VKLRLLSILLCTLLLTGAKYGAGSFTPSMGSLSEVSPAVGLSPSSTSGEAPVSITFTVIVYGTSIGVGDFSLHCAVGDADDDVIISPGSAAHPNVINAWTHSYTFAPCTYTTAGSKTATLYSTIGSTQFTTTTTVTITEQTGAVTTTLTSDVYDGVEPVDYVLTATVSGEAGAGGTNSTSCDFWCDKDDGAKTPLSPVVSADPPYNVATTAECVGKTEGIYDPKAECTRNAQVDADIINVLVRGQSLQATLVADPTYGALGTDVNLIATESGTCPTTEQRTYDFECNNHAADQYVFTTTNRSFDLQADGGEICTYDDDPNDVGSSTPEVTVDCGLAAQYVASAEVLVTSGTSFTVRAYTQPIYCPDENNCTGVTVCAEFGGDATGDVTGPLTIECGDGGLVEHTAAATLTGDTDYCFAACDYTSDATYTIEIADAVRGGIAAATATYDFVVDPTLAVPIFDFINFSENTVTADNRVFVTLTEGDDYGDSSPITFDVTNVGAGTLSWDDSSSESAAWLVCTPNDHTGGVGGALSYGETEEITCDLQTGGAHTNIAVGTHIVWVTYTAAGAAPLFVPITFEVTVDAAPSPTLHLPTSLLTPTAALGSNPTADTFDICNTGSGTLGCLITEDSSTSANGDWVGLSPSILYVAQGDCETATVTYVNADSCALGTQTVTVSVACGTEAGSVDIDLTVTP
jgi:hypothetical protein